MGGILARSWPLPAAAGAMLLAVLPLSFMALGILLVGGPAAPWLFNAVMRLGAALGCFIALLLCFRPWLFQRGVWRAVTRRLPHVYFAAATLGALDYGFLAAAARFIDPAVAAVLYETWPLLLIVAMAWLFRGGGRYARNLRRVLPLAGLALLGAALVVLSETGGFRLGDASAGRLALGVGLALGGTLGAVCAAFSMRWGQETALAGLGAETAARGGGSGFFLFWGFAGDPDQQPSGSFGQPRPGLGFWGNSAGDGGGAGRGSFPGGSLSAGAVRPYQRELLYALGQPGRPEPGGERSGLFDAAVGSGLAGLVLGNPGGGGLDAPGWGGGGGGG